MRTQNEYDNPMQMTFGVQLLLILNIGAYLLEYVFHVPLSGYGALRANWLSHGAFWELITYQFIHQGFGHLFSNMLGLFFLGPEVERTLGTNRFFKLYLFSGVLGGLGWSMLSPGYTSCVGASGAIFGILGAYAALYPKRELILIFFPFMPIKAWIFVLFIGAYELLHILGGPGGAVANSAHLGGGIAGYIYATVIGRPDIMKKFYQKFEPKQKPPVSGAEINRILDKASQHGIHTLTSTEREKLKNANKR